MADDIIIAQITKTSSREREKVEVVPFFSTAAPELKYAEEYRYKAIAVNDAGYPRFAVLLRSIAERYEDDAGRIRGDQGDDDSATP